MMQPLTAETGEAVVVGRFDLALRNMGEAWVQIS